MKLSTLFIWLPYCMVHKWVEKSQEPWHRPIVPALRELRQEDFQEFKTISGYVSEKRLTRAMW